MDTKPTLTAGIQIEVTAASAMRLVAVCLAAFVLYFLLLALYSRYLKP